MKKLTLKQFCKANPTINSDMFNAWDEDEKLTEHDWFLVAIRRSFEMGQKSSVTRITNNIMRLLNAQS